MTAIRGPGDKLSPRGPSSIGPSSRAQRGTGSPGRTARSSPDRAAAAKPLTATYLRNAAMHYLSQRSASTAMLRETLERRAKRRLGVARLEDEARQLIEQTVADLAGLGLVDDARFAEVRATTLAGRGLSKRHIAQRLQMKGIGADAVATTAAAGVDDLAQAKRTIERKRLGSFRRGGSTPETRQKDLAALARAGFSYAVATAALKAAETE